MELYASGLAWLGDVSVGYQARVSSVLCEGAVAANSQSVVIVSFKASDDVTDVGHWSVTTSWDSASHQVAYFVCGAVFWRCDHFDRSNKGLLFLLLSGADFTRRT